MLISLARMEAKRVNQTKRPTRKIEVDPERWTGGGRNLS
jgi:hypothetical protein